MLNKDGVSTAMVAVEHIGHLESCVLRLRDQQERLYCYLFAQKESFHNAVLLWFSRMIAASALASIGQALSSCSITSITYHLLHGDKLESQVNIYNQC